MNEITVVFNLESPQEKEKNILISIGDRPEENLLFKFIIGCDGTWETLKEFGFEETVEWMPKEEGKYIIMVQTKRKDSTKPFDYVTRLDYIIGKVEEKIISNVNLDKQLLDLGDKLKVSVDVKKVPVMYRYWIRENDNWELAKDYSADNTLIWSVKSTGKQEVLVECKTLDSKNKYDDFQKVQFEVKSVKRLEITNFKCLTEEILVGTELVFQVDAAYQDNRMILYKFIKIYSDGRIKCLQDYSTKRIVEYIEKKDGDYRLLCMARDMYSQNEYDDRAVINYTVKPYREVCIQSFTSDLSSPQVSSTNVTLKTIVKGGRELLYRYIIDGNEGEDSGYIKNDTYLWKTKKPGEYKIMVWVKDSSSKENYEASSTMNFTIDELNREPAKIQDIILDKDNKLVKNDTVNVKVIAHGGTELRYSFHVFKDGVEVEKIDYGSCCWVNFTPEEGGNYEIEARVKDKYSKRNYDSHYVINLEVYDFMPALIDQILLPTKEYYVVGDNITYSIITLNTKKTLMRYVMYINGHQVEDTGYVKHKKYAFTPKCSGAYSFQIYAKNVDSTKDFDCRRDIKIIVHEALPVTNTKLQFDRTKININETLTVTAASEGGKEVKYEFYLMERGDWCLVQRYSRKNYYSFIPFSTGNYKILVLSKSEYKRSAYEDYAMMEFNVE